MLYNFCSQRNCTDGDDPYAPLLQAANKNFYGTTLNGGTKGYGTVYEITSGGTLTTLHSFRYSDGANPTAGLIQAKNGNFYGTTLYGGAKGAGTVFEISAAGKLRTLHSFGSPGDGAHPYLVPPEHTASARDILGPAPLLCPEQMVLLETDPSRARDVARRSLAVYLAQPNYANSLHRIGFGQDDLDGGGSDRLVDALVVWGSVDDIRARVAAHFDAGADHVCIQALSAERRGVPAEQWRELAPALAELAAARQAGDQAAPITQ